MTRRPLIITAVTLLSGWSVRAAEPLAKPVGPPEGVSGPYRVVVDRVSHNRKVTVNYRVGGGSREPGPAQFSRTVHLQLAVFARETWAGPGLATFQIKGVTADTDRRSYDLPHYGGMLETPTDGAVLRAYLYVPNFPLGAREIRAIEGEIVAYEKSAPLEIEIPLDSPKVPLHVEKGDVRVSVREWDVEGDTARAVLWVEAPPNSMLINTTTDGTYGVSLHNAAGRSANTLGGAMLQPRANQAEYRVGFQNLRGEPAKLKLRVLHRSGPRRVFPFRVERVPIPERPGVAPPGSPPAKQ
jgi:hypothetical protein